MAYLFDTGIFAANDSSGASLSGAKLTFYDNGTTTLKNTYPTKADAEAGTNANANPVVADANGRWGAIWLDDTFYTVKFQPADGSFTRTRDDIGGAPADLASTASGKGAGLLKFSHNATYAASTVGDRLLRDIYITDHPFNAVCDGSTDDTAAFQAALTFAGNAGGGRVVVPSDTKVTSTLTVTKPDVTIAGFGDRSLILPTGNYGDVIHAYPATGPNLQGFQVEGLYVYAQSETTSGAILHLEDCNGFRVDECRLTGHYGGIYIDGSVHGYIDADVQSDANFTSFKSGSYLFRAGKSSSGSIPAEVHIAKCDWRGQNGNNYLHYAVFIQCADGLFFESPHVGFCKVGWAMNPAANTDTIVSVVVTGGYLDTCSTNLLQCIRPSSSYSADFGLHSLNFSTQYNSTDDGWYWDMESTGKNFGTQIQLGNMLKTGKSGVSIPRCQKLTFLDGWRIAEPGYTTASQSGIILGANAVDVHVGRGVVEKMTAPNTPASALSIANGADKISVNVLRGLSCTAVISDSSTTLNKSIATALTW